MSKGNVNGALKLLTKSMSNGILPLSNKTLDLLKQKHSGEPKESAPETDLLGPFRTIHPLAYDEINESSVMRTAMLTKGSRPTGLDVDGWQRILTSGQFGNSSRGPRKVFAVKNLS